MMNNKSDHPLACIRDSVINHSDISLVDDSYIIGDQRFPMKAKTCFMKTPFPNEAQNGEILYYTMHDIVCFLNYFSQGEGTYRNKIMGKAEAIRRFDQKDLQDFLNGKINTCDKINWGALEAQAAERMTSLPTYAASDIIVDSVEVSHRKQPKRSHAESEKIDEIDTAQQLKNFKADREKIVSTRIFDLPAQDHNSVLLKYGSQDFSNVLKIFNENVLKPQEKTTPDSKSSAGQSSSSSSSSGSTNTPSRSNRPVGTPIIIVPSAVSSVLKLSNAVEFLENGHYEKKDSFLSANTECLIKRSSPENPSIKQLFKIIDNPKMLREEDWDRVVAVFVLGKSWQFKGWKWSQPAELFDRVLGVYLMIQGQTMEPEVSSWNCKVIKIHEHKRHLDVLAFKEFWQYLDDFLSVKKPWYYQSALSMIEKSVSLNTSNNMHSQSSRHSEDKASRDHQKHQQQSSHSSRHGSHHHHHQQHHSSNNSNQQQHQHHSSQHHHHHSHQRLDGNDNSN